VISPVNCGRTDFNEIAVLMTPPNRERGVCCLNDQSLKNPDGRRSPV
jgi:hypothetical protein